MSNHLGNLIPFMYKMYPISMHTVLINTIRSSTNKTLVFCFASFSKIVIREYEIINSSLILIKEDDDFINSSCAATKSFCTLTNSFCTDINSCLCSSNFSRIVDDRFINGSSASTRCGKNNKHKATNNLFLHIIPPKSEALRRGQKKRRRRSYELAGSVSCLFTML